MKAGIITRKACDAFVMVLLKLPWELRKWGSCTFYFGNHLLAKHVAHSGELERCCVERCEEEEMFILLRDFTARLQTVTLNQNNNLSLIWILRNY